MRRNDELLRSSSGGTTLSGCTCIPRSAAPDQKYKPPRARAACRSCWRSPRSSPFVEGVLTHLHSARTEDLSTKFFPRCGVLDWLGSWDDYERYVRNYYATGSIDEHTQLWWRVQPAPRVSDGRDSHRRRPARSRRGSLALRAWLRAHGADRTSARRGRAARRSPAASAVKEVWRAIRYRAGSSSTSRPIRPRASASARAAVRSSSAGCSQSPRSSASRRIVRWRPRRERRSAADRTPRVRRDHRRDLRRTGRPHEGARRWLTPMSPKRSSAG